MVNQELPPKGLYWNGGVSRFVIPEGWTLKDVMSFIFKEIVGYKTPSQSHQKMGKLLTR